MIDVQCASVGCLDPRIDEALPAVAPAIEVRLVTSQPCAAPGPVVRLAGARTLVNRPFER